MTAVCLSYKFGFCKFKHNCDKVHFSESCEIPNCTGFNCNKRHPRECIFFRRFGRCKFGTFCSYAHLKSKEVKLEEEIEDLKVEMLFLKTEMKELKNVVSEIISERKQKSEKVDTSKACEVEASETANDSSEINYINQENKNESDIKKTVEQVEKLSIETKTNPEEETVSKIDINKSEDTLDSIMKTQCLEEIIRENSGLYCEYCPWGPAKTKKGLITHKAKMHSKLYFQRKKT